MENSAVERGLERVISRLRSRLVEIKKPRVHPLHRGAQRRVPKSIVRNRLSRHCVYDRMIQTRDAGLINRSSPKKSDSAGSDVSHLQHCVADQFILHTGVEML